MAAASGSFGFGDKVAAALREAQDVLNQNPLSAAVHLQPSTSAVEASLDRTEQAAKDASAAMGGGAPGSAAAPLVAQDKLIEVMQALVNAIQDETKAKGGAGGHEASGRAKGPPRPPGGPDDESKPGYMNPYTLQSLLNNPLGFVKQSGYSMMSGGAGGGMKPPAWMESLLGGENGLNLGRALASPVGGAGGLGGGFLAGPVAAALPPLALLAGAKIGLSIGDSISGTYDNTAAGQLEDYKLSRRLGFDFRGQAYTDYRMQSRRDIAVEDDRAVLSAMDVGLGHNPSSNVYRAEQVNRMMLNLGMTGNQGGSMIGAMIRSGSVSNMDEGVRLLDKIALYTEKAADAGLSTAEGMRSIAGFSALSARASGGVVTADSVMMSTALGIALDRTGAPELRAENAVQNIASAGEINNNIQRGFLQSGLLQGGPGGRQSLTKHGWDMVKLAFSDSEIAATKKAAGPMADVILAQKALDNRQVGALEKARYMDGDGGPGSAFSLAFMNPSFDVANTSVLQHAGELMRAGKIQEALALVQHGGSAASGDVVGVGGDAASRREAGGAYASRVGKQVDTISGITDDLAAGFRDTGKQLSLLATKTTRLGNALVKVQADNVDHGQSVMIWNNLDKIHRAYQDK